MAQPYVGEIRMFAGNFAPAGWMFCEGQLLSIAENETLFQLIGTTYGGDGQTTFGLPDLRGRLPIHQGNGFVLAETGGAEAVTIAAAQLPAHQHPLVGSTAAASSTAPAGNMAAQGTKRVYRDDAGATVAMAPTATLGGNQPHSNLMPSLCVSFIISLFGIFPSPT
jgi:microcystin-dependent protein